LLRAITSDCQQRLALAKNTTLDIKLNLRLIFNQFGIDTFDLLRNQIDGWDGEIQNVLRNACESWSKVAISG